MEEKILEVQKLCKAYPPHGSRPGFALQDLSFSMEAGYIAGFIGRNGAGKTTALKSMLGIIQPDSGRVKFFGKTEMKQDIGFMLWPVAFFPWHTVQAIASLYSRFFQAWDAPAFKRYLKTFDLDPGKKLRDLSTGMKVKFGLALALGHHARLIILDEPTSGLDPVARDELLDILRGLIKDGRCSVLFSTHITSDLDKCADYIIFIKDGRLVAFDTKDDLIGKHLMLSGKKSDLTDELRQSLIGLKENAFGWTGLALREKVAGELFSSAKGLESAAPNLEDIMLYYNKMEKEDSDEN
jgi:ABC-2 type transport system ATP-binding protein